MTTLNPNARLYLMAVNRPDLDNLQPFLLYSEPGDITEHIQDCVLSADWQEEVNPDMDLDCPDISWLDVLKVGEVTESSTFLHGYRLPWGEATAEHLSAGSIFDRIHEAKEHAAQLAREAENAKRQVVMFGGVQ